MNRFALTLILGVFWVVPAHANADGDLLASLGVVGKWAEHCDQKPGPDNAHLLYSTPGDGPPTEQLIMSDQDGDRRDPLSDVRLLADGKVQWTQVSGDTIFVIVNLFERTRLKTWSSTDTKGDVYIRDGAYAKSKGEAPWFYKCGAK